MYGGSQCSRSKRNALPINRVFARSPGAAVERLDAPVLERTLLDSVTQFSTFGSSATRIGRLEYHRRSS